MKRLFSREFYSSPAAIVGLILIYCILVSALYAFRTAPYHHNVSSLIGLWKGFAAVNPKLIPKGTVVFSEGGYDGQFFFLNAAYLFDSGSFSPPVLDSFLLRFSRIGFSFLGGFISSFTGWNNYAWNALLILNFFHLLSTVLLWKILPSGRKFLSLLYLFSPFSVNSNLLLVSDSFLASLFLLSVYVLSKAGLSPLNFGRLEKAETAYSRRNLYWAVFIVVILFLFTKETAVLYVLFFLGAAAGQGRVWIVFSILPALLIYSAFLIYLHFFMRFYSGTMPLSFLQLSDWPFAGFLKSIQLNNLISLKQSLREASKFPLFLLMFLGFFTSFFCWRNFWKETAPIGEDSGRFFSLLLLFSLFPAVIAEQGYWLTFDNISRFFTMSVPLFILTVSEKEGKGFRILTLVFGIILAFLFLSLLLRSVWLKSPMEYLISDAGNVLSLGGGQASVLDSVMRKQRA